MSDEDSGLCKAAGSVAEGACVGEGGQMVAGVPVALEGLVAASDHGLALAFAEDDIDPGELRQNEGLALAYDDVRLSAARIDLAAKTDRATAAHITDGHQLRPGRGDDGFKSERLHLGTLHPHKVLEVGSRHCEDDRELVRLAATTNARAITAEVSIVDLHVTRQRLLSITRRNDGHQHVAQRQERAVVVAQSALEHRRRQFGLVLAKHEHRKNLEQKQHLGAAHDATHHQHSFEPTALKLGGFASEVQHQLCTA